MQDRFKFRVWNNEADEYIGGYDDCFEFIHLKRCGELDTSGDFIIEQCTGLKDKNGKLIYEGDIVFDELYVSPLEDRYRVVRYEEDGMGDDYSTLYMIGYNIRIREGEIIGNIHENPELLK